MFPDSLAWAFMMWLGNYIKLWFIVARNCVKIEDMLDAAFFPFFPSRLLPSFTCRVFWSVTWWKASISAFSAFACTSHSKRRFYFFPNMRLCEMNHGLCLITVFFLSSIFLLCWNFDWFCVVKLVVLSGRVERKQYFLVKPDEFSVMRIICKTPRGKGDTFICSKASVKYKDVRFLPGG